MIYFRKRKASVLIDNDEIRLSYIMTDTPMLIFDEGEDEDFKFSSYVLLTEKKESLHFDKHENYLQFFDLYLLENNEETKINKVHIGLVDSEISEDIIHEARVEVINYENDIHYLYAINHEMSRDSKGDFLIKYDNPTHSVKFKKVLKHYGVF